MAFEVDGRIYIKLEERGELNSHDKRFDDGAGGHMKQILLWHDPCFISGIQTICERGGVNQISKKHGGTQGNFEMINLRRPLTWVSGHYGSYCIDPEIFVDEEEAPWNYYKVVTSLKFGNEEETYGPFGLQRGTSFVFRAGSEITGFHGTSSDASTAGFGYISSIGLYFRTEAVSAVGDPSRSSTEQIEAQGTLIKGEN